MNQLRSELASIANTIVIQGRDAGLNWHDIMDVCATAFNGSRPVIGHPAICWIAGWTRVTQFAFRSKRMDMIAYWGGKLASRWWSDLVCSAIGTSGLAVAK
jgi:hypothetical protein